MNVKEHKWIMTLKPSTMKIRLSPLHLLFMIATAAGAQNQVVIDSLNSVLTHKSGADRYAPLYELAFEYIDRDNQRALEIIREAEDAALLSGDSLWIVKSIRVRAQVLSRLMRLAESVTVCRNALQIVRRNGFVDEEAIILNSLATSYSFFGKDDIALEYFFKTLEIAENRRDSSLRAQALNNIGVFYYRLGAFQKALDYFLSSLAVSKSINDVRVYHLNNIAMCYASLNDFTEANWFVEESKRVCGDDCEESNSMLIRFTEALILLNDKKTGEARKEFFQCYASARRENAVRLQLEVIDVLAELYLEENRLTETRILLNEAEKFVNAGYPFSQEIMAIYSRFIQLHRLTRNFKLMAHYSDKYLTLKDSVENDALTISLMRIEGDFRERQNLAKIAAQDEVILLKEEIINRQKLLNSVIAFLGVTLLAFILLLFRNYRGKKKLNQLLVQKVKERTLQLETNQNDLLKVLKERDLELKRVSSIVSETVSSTKGLCFAGCRELTDEKSHLYFRRILKTLERLSHNLVVVRE